MYVSDLPLAYEGPRLHRQQIECEYHKAVKLYHPRDWTYTDDPAGRCVQTTLRETHTDHPLS